MSKILKTCFYKDIATLDPRESGDIISSSAIFLLFRGLTRLLVNQEVVFDLADSLEISRDKKRYTFYLGEHYWSDGRPITAFDVENSWKTVLRPDFASLSSHLFYPIKNAAAAKAGAKPLSKVGVRAEGARQLVVELEYPVPYFLELISFCAFFPVPTHSEDQFSSKQQPFVSSGPFQLVDWQPNSHILFKRNSRLSHAASLELIQIRIIADPKEAFSLFKEGELDWVGEPFSPLPLNHLPVFAEEWESQAIGGVTLCFFNTRLFPFSNQKVRRAFSYAIHREKILRKLFIPNTAVATGLIPPILKKNRKKEFFSDGDLEAAQKLFQEGIQELEKNLKRQHWVLSFEASEVGFQIAKSLQSDWEEAFDIRIHLEPLEFKIFYDRLAKREYMLSFTQWIAQYNSPMNFLERLQNPESRKNFCGWSHRNYTRMLEQCLKQVDTEKYIDFVEQAERILVDEMPIAPLYYFSYSYLQKSNLKNLLFSPIGRVYLEEAFFETKDRKELSSALKKLSFEMAMSSRSSSSPSLT
jgi:oligopeptide transport system substrate-binding protein